MTRRTPVVLVLAVLISGSSICAQDASGSRVKPQTKPDAPIINVFTGMKAKQLEVRLVQRSEKVGTLFVRNRTEQDVTVEFPPAFVGIHVLNQQARANGNGRAGAAQSTAASISVRSRVPSSRAGAGPAENGPAHVLFPIAAEKSVQLPITSACLEYGRPEPNARMQYTIIPIERYSRNPIFHELLPLFAKKKVSQKIAQAAAWHLSSNLSWTELSAITVSPAVPLPLFDTASLRKARALIDEATSLARTRQEEKAGVDKPKSASSS